MADIALYVPYLDKWEDGYVHDPDDPGGLTYMGITLKTWLKVGFDKNNDGIVDVNDLLLLTHEERIYKVFKPYYWDVWQADRIENQSIANLLVDWLINSGTRTISIVQQLLDVKKDGIVGRQTLAAINSHPDPEALHEQIKTARVYYIDGICARRPVLNKFKRGWKYRIADFMYAPIVLLCLVLGMLTGGCRSQKNVLQTAVADSIASAAVTQIQTDDIFSKVQTDSLIHRSSSYDQLVEILDVLFSLTGTMDTMGSIKPVRLSGVAQVRRVKQSASISNTNHQQNQTEQSRQVTSKDQATRQTTVQNKSVTSRQYAKPRDDKSSFLVMLVLLFVGLLLYIYLRKR
jgi:hypothetical protein